MGKLIDTIKKNRQTRRQKNNAEQNAVDVSEEVKDENPMNKFSEATRNALNAINSNIQPKPYQTELTENPQEQIDKQSKVNWINVEGEKVGDEQDSEYLASVQNELESQNSVDAEEINKLTESTKISQKVIDDYNKAQAAKIQAQYNATHPTNSPIVNQAYVNGQNANPELFQGEGATHSQHGTNWDRFNSPTSGISHQTLDLYGTNPVAASFIATHEKPVAPEYDPRREKALNWQKAIVALGKLGGVIHDVKTVGDNGIVNVKPQGKEEMDAIDTNIAKLKSIYSSQYNTYIEADKAYRKGLYEAYKQDEANKLSYNKALMPLYSENIMDSYRWSQMSEAQKRAAMASNSRRAAQKGMMRIVIPDNDGSGVPNVINVTKDEWDKYITKSANSLFAKDPTAMKQAIIKFAEDGLFNIEGYNPSIDGVEKLFTELDQNTLRENFFKFIKENPTYAFEWACDTHNLPFMRIIEGYCGVPEGSFTADSKDRDYLIYKLTQRFGSFTAADYRRFNMETLVTAFENEYNKPFVSGKTRLDDSDYIANKTQWHDSPLNPNRQSAVEEKEEETSNNNTLKSFKSDIVDRYGNVIKSYDIDVDYSSPSNKIILRDSTTKKVIGYVDRTDPEGKVIGHFSVVRGYIRNGQFIQVDSAPMRYWEEMSEDELK